jgi:hypothetical protein
MKPLFMINATGPSLMVVLGGMINQCNDLLKNVEGIRFLETVHNVELNTLRQPVVNVGMIFEIDSEKVRLEIEWLVAHRPEMEAGKLIPLQ